MSEEKDLDSFLEDQEQPERKIKIHEAGDDSTCTSCEG